MHHFRRPSRYRGNISLLVIFILLGSSLIALLAMSQLRNLITYGATTSNYFKAYYLAKAGLELAITETSLRDAGFEVSVHSWDALVSGNVFVGWEGFEPYFEIEGTHATSSLENVTLGSWESVVIPLFVDTTVCWHKACLSDERNVSQFKASEIQGIKVTTTKEVFFWIFTFSGNNLDSMVGMVNKTGTNLNTFLNSPQVEWWDEEEEGVLKDETTRKYLTILNMNSTPVTFTVTSSKAFPLDTTTINVWSHYGDTEVGLQADFSEPFPNFLQGLSQVDVE